MYVILGKLNIQLCFTHFEYTLISVSVTSQANLNILKMSLKCLFFNEMFKATFPLSKKLDYIF